METYFISGLDSSDHQHHVSRILGPDICDGGKLTLWSFPTCLYNHVSATVDSVGIFMERNRFPPIFGVIGSRNLEGLSLGFLACDFIHHIGY